MSRSLLVAVILFVLFILPGRAGAQLSVRASYGSFGVSQIILPIAARSGMFHKNGLSVEPVYIAGRSVSALVSGDVQFGLMGGPPAVLARLGGADVVMIAGRNALDQILIATSSIKKPADLAGKNVGISRFGTTSDYGARIGLKRLKLEPQRDVTLIQIGDTAARISGMTAGAIAAATLNAGEEEYIRKMGFHILTDNADVEFPGNALVTTQRYLRTNRESVKRFVRGLVETIQFIKDQPEKTKSLLAEIYRESDAGVTGKRYDAMIAVFPDYPYLTANAVRSFLEILREEGKLKGPLDPGTFLDMSLLQEVEKERRR
jgi:NitT/TauT family transport system substrate-binding protein